MELIGIVFMLSLLAAALWGVWVAVTIILNYRDAALWLKWSVTLIISCLVIWMLDSRSFDDMMRRSLRLLDAGLIIAVGDGIARANRWIGDHTGCPLPARSRRRWVRVVTNRQAAG
jgi:hypothetical protein